jgi:hypothetical protein
MYDLRHIAGLFRARLWSTGRFFFVVANWCKLKTSLNHTVPSGNSGGPALLRSCKAWCWLATLTAQGSRRKHHPARRRRGEQWIVVGRWCGARRRRTWYSYMCNCTILEYVRGGEVGSPRIRAAMLSAAVRAHELPTDQIRISSFAPHLFLNTSIGVT